jgi:hypothetical protein
LEEDSVTERGIRKKDEFEKFGSEDILEKTSTTNKCLLEYCAYLHLVVVF